MASNANDNAVLYTPVRITNPEDIVGGGAAGTVTIGAGTAVIGHVIVDTLPALVAGSAAVGTVGVTSVSPPTAIFADVKSVTTAGTRVALGSSQALKRGVTIYARLANTGSIYVGTAAAVSSTVYGREIKAGESVFVECDNLNLVGLDSAVNGEGVSYIAS